MPEAVEAEGEVEGEEEAEAGSPVPEGALALGTAVKARYQGGDKYCAGMIHAANPDGTHDVLYDDHVLEQGVPRDMIEVVEMEANVAADLAAGDGQTVANSVNEFFETFVASLTSGAAFARLDAQQQVSIANPHTLSGLGLSDPQSPPLFQAFASEKVRAMRPHFEAEFEALRERRGWGATVTGADINEMMPKVMARAKAAAAAARAAAE